MCIRDRSLHSPHCNVTISRGIDVFPFVLLRRLDCEALSASKRGYQQTSRLAEKNLKPTTLGAPFKPSFGLSGFRVPHPAFFWRGGIPTYAIISLMVPAPTVRPPSRIANRKPFSIATGVINSISRLTLSPGITISVPAGKLATPVTSCLLYTSDAADDLTRVDLGGRRIL